MPEPDPAPGVGRRRRALTLTLAVVMAAGVVSRLIVLASAFAAAGSARADSDPAHWNRPDTALWPLLRWDAGFYLEIAERGYSRADHGGGSTTLGFFPGYPLAVRSVARATGLGAPAAAVLVSHVAFFLGLALVGVLTEERFGSRVARLAGAVLAFLPWSAFASFPYSEALFLLAAAGALAACARERWWLAAAATAVATFTRLVGLAVVAALALDAARRRLAPAALAALAGLAGITAFAVFLGLRFGEPLEFAHAIDQPAWKRSPLDAPRMLLLAPARSVYHLATGRGSIGDLDVWLFAGSLFLLWRQRRRIPPDWLAFAVTGLLLPAGSGSLGSIGRYVFPLFPISVAAALGLERRRPAVVAAVLALLASGLVLIAGRYASWRWES